MTSKDLYEKHLADAQPGTPLHAVFERVRNGTASAADLIAYAEWEMWEAIYSLPPEAGAKGEQNNSGEVSRVVDGFHASCCVERALGAVRQLAKLGATS